MNIAKEQKAIKEFDTISLTVPLEGEDVFDSTRILQLPVGTRGTVVDMLGDHDAYEVEFLIREWADPDDFTSVQIPVEVDQCERVDDPFS